MRCINLPSLPFPPQRYIVNIKGFTPLKSTQNMEHLMTLENMATLEKVVLHVRPLHLIFL